MPFLVKNFTVFQLTQALVYAIAILGLNLLTGFNGQFSLGHSAFCAIGAYTAAILMDRYGVPYWATLVPAGVTCLRSEEHTSELQSLMRISYAVFCLKKKNRQHLK